MCLYFFWGDVIDLVDCEGCKWMGYDPLENEEVCVLNDEVPIGDIESCNADEIEYKSESIVIEERRDN